MIKKLARLIVLGMAVGCLIMTLISMFFAAASHGSDFSVGAGTYIRNAVCSMAVGIGFLVPTVVYEKDALPMGMRVLIHMGIGLIVYFICSFIAGWIPVNMGAGAVAADIIGALAVAWIIWLVCYSYNRHEAKRMNEKIREKKEE
jgi:hypothetical protein